MSYYTEVYLDILDDFDCLCTVYQFTTLVLADEFIHSVPFVCSQIIFSETELKLTNVEPIRPVYSKIEDAIEDAQEFYQYADTPNYRYYQNVYRIPLTQAEQVQITNQCNRFEENYYNLKNELAEVKDKLEKLEKKLEDTKLEQKNQELTNQIEDLSIN